MNEDGFADRRRATEEEYFRKRDRELIENMRKRADRDTTSQRLLQLVGVADEDVLNRLEALGFSDETLPLLYIAPLVQVAWADGRMSPAVSRRIVETARVEGIEVSSAADRRLDEWLRSKPPETLFHEAHRLLARLLLLRDAERADERDPDARRTLQRRGRRLWRRAWLWQGFQRGTVGHRAHSPCAGNLGSRSG